MATVEIAKRLVGLRSVYQRRQVELWLWEKAEGRPSYLIALADLDQALGLATGAERSSVSESVSQNNAKRRRRTLFDLPIGQLVAQISAAIDTGFADPNRYQALLSVLVGESFLTERRANVSGSDRMRESQQIRTAIDQLQISVGERWRRYVQGTALWLSGLYGFALAFLLNIPGRSVYVLSALFIGGLFSWIARDVASGVERWRR
jgi:hypothetical protein